METLEKRRPKQVWYMGRVYVPGKPTKFWVGSKTWHKDENTLQVQRGPNFPEDVWVSCLQDVQIMFPPAEVWRVRDRYDRLREDERERLVAIVMNDQGNGWTFALAPESKRKYPQAPQVFVERSDDQKPIFEWMAPPQLAALVGLLTGCETNEANLAQAVFISPDGSQLFPKL